MNKLRVLDLFSGIGGFSLGLERTGGFETVAFCEIEEFPRKVLRKHWPKVPIYEDVRTLTAGRLAADGIAVDVICGGFPCQPFSTASAGRRVAKDLWPEFWRVISEVGPEYVIIENVAELPIKRAALYCASLGMRQVIKRIGGNDCGADHTRNRWWACAYPHNKGELRSAINAEVAGLSEICRGVWGAENYARAVRIPHGLPNRVERNRALGNAVMPPIVEAWGRAILASMKEAA
jgi:DNA (cytosine-5)-methyltransferase 1